VKALGDGIAFLMHPAHSRLSIDLKPTLGHEHHAASAADICNRAMIADEKRLVFDCLVDKGKSRLRAWAKFGDCFRVGGTLPGAGADRRADVFTRNHVQDDRAVPNRVKNGPPRLGQRGHEHRRGRASGHPLAGLPSAPQHRLHASGAVAHGQENLDVSARLFC